MKITFISHSLEGHRLSWLNALIKELQDEDREIEIWSLRDESNEASLSSNFKFYSSKWQLIYEIYFQKKSRIFFFIEADNWLMFLIFLSCNGAGVILRYIPPYGLLLPRFKYFLKRLIFIILSNRKFFSLYILKVPFNLLDYGIPSECWVSDSIQIRNLNQYLIKRGNNNKKKRNVVSIIGFIDTRKNIELVIDALTIARRSFPNIVLEIVGVGKPEYIEYLRSIAPEWVTIENRYLDEKSYYELIRTSSLLMLVYKNHGSSGILLEALYLGTPVVLPQYQEFEGIARKLPDWVKRSELNPLDLSLAIMETLKLNYLPEGSFQQVRNAIDIELNDGLVEHFKEVIYRLDI